MIVYEVSANVEPELVPAYERYMREHHIADVLATGCFVGAAMLKTGESRYCILYELTDHSTLTRYLDDHAPALRADFARHFPNGVELSRDVWQVLEEWPRSTRTGDASGA